MKINKVVAYIIGIYFIICMVFWKFSDSLAIWGLTANPVISTIVNLILNPFYVGSVILIFELFFKGYKLNRNKFNYIRVTLASLLVSLSLDIASLIHTITINYGLPDSPQLSIYFDTVIGKLLNNYLSGTLGTFVIYVIIPVVLFVIALFIASPSNFLNIIKAEVGH